MRYLTKDWYLMSQQYPMPEEVQEKVHAAWKAFREAQAREDIPQELAGRLSLHDGDVTGVVMGEDCVLAVDSPYSGSHRITFRNAVSGPEQPAEPEPPPEGAALGTGEGFLLLAALRDGENLPLALALFWLLG